MVVFIERFKVKSFDTNAKLQNIIAIYNYLYFFFSFQSFSSCPFEVDESVKPKDCINNQFDLENEIQSFSGNIKGQGSFVLKNGDYFEGTVHYLTKRIPESGIPLLRAQTSSDF